MHAIYSVSPAIDNEGLKKAFPELYSQQPAKKEELSDAEFEAKFMEGF